MNTLIASFLAVTGTAALVAIAVLAGPSATALFALGAVALVLANFIRDYRPRPARWEPRRQNLTRFPATARRSASRQIAA
ncbi:MAG: hypothetical protein H3C27_09210 [Opitutaceae bacterium]|nr:hypothetical protein [Opitutaceae bacterium]